MKWSLPSLPVLFVWLVFSAIIFWVGAGFGGSWSAFTVGPPIREAPVAFALWCLTLCIVFAPVVLIPVRLLTKWFRRENNA